ncbi:G protein alpha-subunit [Apiospora phragmitis]|uniref:G protein alpha-subunit n=1 Tax=Apiospora phragmitis TaxID=2905665 RepID=A0ABR1UKM0_9PEZI
MDPFTVFQVVGTAVSLGDVVIKSLIKLDSIRTRYHKFPLLLSTMIGQLYIVQLTLDRLSAWNSREEARAPRYHQLSSQIGNSLDSFSTLILALQQQLDRFEATAPVDMGAKAKFKFLWNEKDMSEYSILLERQTSQAPSDSSLQQVLFLGTSESGKSTLQNSMVLDQEGFSDRFGGTFTDTIRNNLVNGTREVLQYMQHLQIPLGEQGLEFLTKTDSRPDWVIEGFWSDPGFQKAYFERHRYHLNDGYAHFVRHMGRIMAPGYVPSDQDIIYARVKTLGTLETKYEYEGTMYSVREVGGTRLEREKKWKLVFPGTATVRFTVDITSYARTLYEDEKINRMAEQLVLFDSIVNGSWFTKSSFVLVFTKDIEDISEERYMGYIELRFMELVKSEDIRRRMRVIRSSFRDVDACNPAQEIFEVLGELTRDKAQPTTTQ